MIQADELRKGNLFIDTVGAYCQPNTIQQVKTISEEGVNKWKDMGASGCCPFDKMEPIHLNRQIFRKLQFIEGPPASHKERAPFWIIRFIPINQFNECSLYINDSASIWMGKEWIKTDIQLHELQNLFFFLSGKELNVSALK